VDNHNESQGRLVHVPPSPGRPRLATYGGSSVELVPIDVAHAPALFAASHGADAEWLWTYLPYGPFESEQALAAWIEPHVGGEEPMLFTALDAQSHAPIGVVGLLNIVPEHLRLELGHIWYAPTVQRTQVNTEAAYLLLCEAFDVQRYRRVEWKCDSLNAGSRAAALRLGFAYEGTFRNHLVVKGRNRDTTWFAMTSDDWPTLKANLERWLYYNPNRKLSLSKLNRVG
jgi:RimJ/RimL family protein N-acetyltransferase